MLLLVYSLYDLSFYMLTCLFLVEMATRFRKKKLAEMKEKKDKSVSEEGGFISKRHCLEKKAKDEAIEKPEVVLQPAIPSSL